MPPPDSESGRWFAQHLQPHEPMLRAWLQSRFPRSCEIDDVLQEAFVRVLRAHEVGPPLESPKAFLFAVARNLALDQVRRRQVTGADHLMRVEDFEVMDDGADVAETVSRNQELELLTEAIQALPDRCRRIFTLRKIYGMAQPDIARKLGISEHTVSAQLTIGVHKCTEFLHRRRGERGGRP